MQCLENQLLEFQCKALMMIMMIMITTMMRTVLRVNVLGTVRCH